MFRRFGILVNPKHIIPPVRGYRHSQDYVDPLVIDTVLISTHYKLTHLENKVLMKTFHITRLKLAFVPTPSGSVNTQGKLNKVICSTDSTDNAALKSSTSKSRG